MVQTLRAAAKLSARHHQNDSPSSTESCWQDCPHGASVLLGHLQLLPLSIRLAIRCQTTCHSTIYLMLIRGFRMLDCALLRPNRGNPGLEGCAARVLESRRFGERTASLGSVLGRGELQCLSRGLGSLIVVRRLGEVRSKPSQYTYRCASTEYNGLRTFEEEN